MEENVVFVVAKKENGNLCYAENNLAAEDALTLLAMVTSYVYKVGADRIGLTDEEIQKNIADAVEAGVQSVD